MRFGRFFFICTLLIASIVAGCNRNKQVKFPDTTPQETVTQFFRLLADGGRLSSQEALKMVSTKYGEINQENFRKWTENFGASRSKIKIVNTTLPQTPDKKGNWIAVVKLEVNAPSMFGDSFTSTSQINLILDEKEKEWKIDFLGDTIDESSFRGFAEQPNGTNTATK